MSTKLKTLVINAMTEKEGFHVGNPRQEIEMFWAGVKLAKPGDQMAVCVFQQS